jgi:prepilin peptidase CpaA
MTLIATAPIWLIAVLAALLVAAAAEDVARLRVSNITVLAVIASAALAVALAGPSLAIWQNLLVFALLLAGGTLLFGLGKVGGGDVKLFAAVGLWTNLHQGLILVSAVFIAGGVVALAVLLPRLLSRSGGKLRDGKKMVPYALAIAAGGLLVIALQRTAADARRASPLDYRPLAAGVTTGC